jgi:predicted helicase
VEVLRHIDAALKENGGDATRAAKLKKAAKERIFGFELLPAPFVISHLQLGLFLHDAGAGFSGAERAGVYLTNALTGWEPPREPRQRLLFPEMEAERDAADGVKQSRKIIVVLGNPPYNGFAGVAVAEERSLSDAYRWKKGDPEDLKPQGQGLNDLYVRFYRMAERCILGNEAGEGIVCFISNYSWLDGLSFPLMRERYLNGFDAIWVDSLNGDKYRTGKLTPDGKPDPSAFSTDRNREGIQVGTAVALMLRKKRHGDQATIHYRDFWGAVKLKELEAFAGKWSARKYTPVEPVRELGVPFRPIGASSVYGKWPGLTELFPKSYPGVQTKRDAAVIDYSKERLKERMTMYFDPSVSNDVIAREIPAVMASTKRYHAAQTRSYLCQRGFLPQNVVPHLYRPFDLRWIYWEPETKLLGEKSPEYFPQLATGTIWLAMSQRSRIGYDPPNVTGRLASLHLIEWSANLFPLKYRRKPVSGLFGSPDEDGERFNLSDRALAYLANHRDETVVPELFFHTIAVLHAPAYAAENADALSQDWPRVPLPATAKQLRSSAALGRQVADLLDPESRVEGVTARTRPELKVIGVPTRVGGGQFDPGAGDLDVAARWGIAGKGGVCMPGPGKAVERAYTPEERKALGPAGVAALGEKTYDVYLNERAYWRNVPARVWDYTLGGYQVIKKFLSYREKALLGRGLKLEEVELVRDIARRIAALRLLGPELDANYAAVKADLFEWPSAGRSEDAEPDEQ